MYAPDGRRTSMYWLLVARTAILLVVAPVLGVIALITGHGDAALPIFVIVGLVAVLSFVAWLRRRSSSSSDDAAPPAAQAH
jgi:flagellar biosynthesis component FlhA